MNDDEESAGATGEGSASKFTEQDLLLGKKASKYIDIICLLALIATLGMAVFVLLNVPLDTRLDYSGRFGRNGLPMPAVMLLPPLFLFFLWRTGKRPDAHHMKKPSRLATYVVGTVMVSVCIFFQGVFAEAALIAGGVLPS